jgi:hypothetical protein
MLYSIKEVGEGKDLSQTCGYVVLPGVHWAGVRNVCAGTAVAS